MDTFKMIRPTMYRVRTEGSKADKNVVYDREGSYCTMI